MNWEEACVYMAEKPHMRVIKIGTPLQFHGDEGIGIIWARHNVGGKCSDMYLKV